MGRHPFFDFLNGYEEPDVVNGRSVTGKRFFVRRYSGSMTDRRKKLASGYLFSIVKRVASVLTHTTAKAYGAFLLTFGISSLFINFVKGYFDIASSYPMATLVIGALLSVLGLPSLFFDKPIAHLLEDTDITNFIFYEFFCIKRSYRTDNQRGVHTAVMVMIAFILSSLCLFVPAPFVVLGMASLLFAALSFAAPEFALFSSILLLPLYGIIPYADIAFSAIAVVALLSLLRKALAGKRVICLEQYDVIIALMFVCVLASGVFLSGVESFLSALLLLAMGLGYFLFSNLVTNRRLAVCAIGAISVSSLFPAICSVIRVVMAARSGLLSELILSGVSSTFASADAAAVFFSAAVIFSAVLAGQNGGSARVFFGFVMVLDAAALLLTGEVFAVVALLFGVLAYFALKARAFAALFLPILFFAPYASLLLFPSILEPVFEFVPTGLDAEETVELWRAAVLAVMDNPFGIGIGSESFKDAMAEYGEFAASDANNLFIEFALEAGVLALVLFVLLLAVRLRHRARYYRYVKSSELDSLAPAVSVCVFVLLCYGATDYIWSDLSMFYLFWCVFGLGSATLRVSKKELDDRVLYFEDTRRTYSSSVSVNIR